MDEIPVVAETGSEFEARLWEIAENLHRAELTALERAEHISQWIRLRDQTAESRPCDQADNKLGQVGPVSELNKAAPAVLAPGGRGREGGVRAAARELGISRTDARRAVHRVHIIAREVREALRDMPEIADNEVELDALAALPAEQQAAAVAAVRNGTAPNVRAAIATIAEPTSCAAAKADQALDAILEQIRRLGKRRPGKAVGRPCRSVAPGNQPSVNPRPKNCSDGRRSARVPPRASRGWAARSNGSTARSASGFTR
jgi:hypothetical protein